MKTTALTGCLMAAALVGCTRTPPTLVPKSPHGGVLYGVPDAKGWLEIVREDDPDKPIKTRIVAYFLDDHFRPLEPRPTAVFFAPKAPRGAPTVELKPTSDADPSKASGLVSPPIDNSGSIAGELSATIGGKTIATAINIR